MLSLFLGALYVLGTSALGRISFSVQHVALGSEPAPNGAVTTFSMDVTDCPGYTLGSLQESDIGLTAQLTLAGPACNAFGLDISDLTIEATYQSLSTLRIKIYDTANQQFTIPESVIELPVAPTTSYLGSSDPLCSITMQRLSHFGSSDAPTPMQCPYLIRELRHFHPLPFYLLMRPIRAQHLMVSLSCLKINTSRLLPLCHMAPTYKDGGVGTIHTHWSRDIRDPIDENMYGSHPIYLEHRYNVTTGDASSSGVFLLSAAGSDILLQTPLGSKVSLIEYRMIDWWHPGLLLPLRIDEYRSYCPVRLNHRVPRLAASMGLWVPPMQMGVLSDDKENVAQMRAAGVSLEVQWNDIDLYHAYRDFTTDPVSFPADELRAFVQELAANHQHWPSDIPIVDAGIAVTVNSTDVYDPTTLSHKALKSEDVWIKNPDGSLYVGEVWPGYTFSENILSVWTEGLKNWSNMGVEFSGIWLGMNEPSSFCSYSCGSGGNYLALTPLNVSARVITGYPECYNDTIWEPSGNMTINGTSTYTCAADSTTMAVTEKRGVGPGGEQSVTLNSPPYAIHNGFGGHSQHTLATNATHYGGYAELDVHNMFGLMEEKTTYFALQSILSGGRPS
ncbi:hypothetical protein M405DRAFT_869826 [Rhizopogon salebrosus TDB-379]|nr:hypothetical protein M405DRAFT_869826 [Rhizopogon salebrosus TDB-379]